MFNIFSRFIEKYGTHVVVGVKVGGKDIIHVKQLRNSNLQSHEVLKFLKQVADQRFSEEVNPFEVPGKLKVKRRLKFFSSLFWSVNILLICI